MNRRTSIRSFILCLASICLAGSALAQVPQGAILWLSADSGVVAAPDGAVSRWRDRSGNGNDAWQEGAASRPRLVAKGPNGRPVLRFNGAVCMVGASVFPVGSDYSVTFVVKLGDASIANNVVSGTTRANWFGGDFHPKVMHGANFSAQAISSIAVTPYYNVVTMTYREGDGQATIHVNGLPAGSSIVGPNLDSTLYIGAFNGGSSLSGDLAEVVLYRRGLDEAERHQLDTYLLKKYAISVPASYAAPATGPLLWLKADFGVVTSRGRVSRWLDCSGNGHVAFQDSVLSRPTLLPNAVFDLPAVHFSGGGEFLEAPPVFPTRSDYTLMVAVRLNGMTFANNVISGTRRALWFGETPYARGFHGDVTAQATSAVGVERFAFAVVTMTYLESRRLAVIHVNGIVADSEEVGTNLDSTIFLGAFAGTGWLCGDLAEVMLYDRKLGSADRRMSENYLFAKYGIPVPPPPPPPLASFLEIPSPMQLYPRGDGDSAVVTISGSARASEYDSIYVSIFRNGAPWKRLARPLPHEGGAGSRFELRPAIHAELCEYRFVIGLSSPSSDTVLAVRDSVVCGDVILIDGQSNAIFGNRSGETFEYCRTFGLNASSRSRDTLWALARADGFGGGAQVGAWGHRLQRTLVESQRIPICVINGGVGGSTLEQHMRNDGDPADPRTIYGSLLYRAVKAGVATKVRALIWYQGESNTIKGYYAGFRRLYERWRADYPGLEKIYVAQIRPGCNTGPNGDLRELLRTLGDSLADVVPFSVMAVPGHDGCHFTAAGYDTIGVYLYGIVARDLYGGIDTVDVAPPGIRAAYFTDASRREIALLFSNSSRGISTTPDVRFGERVMGIEEAFLFDGTLRFTRSVRASGDTLFLTLASPYPISTISYVPGFAYRDTALVYEGPWLTNARGIGAFSFDRVPVGDGAASAGVINATATTMSVSALPNPFVGSTILRIIVRSAGRIGVTVVDGLGREVESESLDGAPGQNSIVIGRGKLAAGFYLCEVTAGGEHRYLPVIAR